MTFTFVLMGTAAGIAIGCAIPGIARKIIAYKCRQRGRPEPEESLGKGIGRKCIAIMALFSAFALLTGFVSKETGLGYKAYFLIFFAAIALTISLVDCSIHLIPNEAVLLLLALGIIYRVVFDGVSSLLNALLALGIAILIFGGSSALFFLLKKRSGLGAGDLKYAFAISMIVGTSGMLYFLGGMAIAVLAYVFIGMRRHLFSMTDYFPMAAHLSCGFAVALLAPFAAVVSQFVTIF